LNIGAKVETINMTEVSATPESRSYSSGYQNAGAVGVIVEGPYMNGITPWFKVDYESGVDGWSTAVSFRLIATSTVSQTTATTSTTSTTSTTATTSTTSTTTDVAGTVGAAYSTFTGYFRTMTNFIVSSIRSLFSLVMSVFPGGDNTSGDQFVDLTNLIGSGISDSDWGTSGSGGGLFTTAGVMIDAPSLNLLREYLIEYRSSLEPITITFIEPTPPPAEPVVIDPVSMPPVNVVSVTGVVNVSYSDGRGANQIISAALEGAGIPVINVPSDATGVNVRIQADCTSACLTYTGNFRDNVSTAGQLHVDISRPLTQSTVVGAVAGDMTSGSVGEFVEIRMASQSPVGTSAEQLEDLYTRAAGYSRPVTAYPLPPVSISGGIQLSSLSLSDYIFSEQAVAKVNQLAYEATLQYPTEFANINSASELVWNQLYDQVLLQVIPPPHPELLDTDLGFLWSELTPTQRLQRLSDYIKGFNFAASLIFERKSVKQQVVVLTQSEGGNKDELDKLENQLANLETAINYTIFYLYEIDSELFNHSASVDRGSLPEQQVQALFEADFAYLSLSAVDAKLPDSNEIVPAVGDPDALYSQRKQWEEILLGILVGKPFAAMVDRTLGDNPVYPLPLPVPFSPSN